MRNETFVPRVNAFSPSLNVLNIDFDNRDLDLFDTSLTSMFLGNSQKQCLEEDKLTQMLQNWGILDMP